MRFIRNLTGFTFRFDTYEDKTVDMIFAEVNQHPRKYNGCIVQTGIDICRFDGEGNKIKSGDVEVLYNEEPYALIEIKVGTDANSKNLESQMNKLLDAPHQFKALIVSGRFWEEKLIKGGWGYELSPMPPRRLLQFVSFCRLWWQNGIWVYWVSDVRHVITKIFNFIYNPPQKSGAIIQKFVSTKYKGSDFCKKLQVISGVSYDVASAVSDVYPTPFDFFTADYQSTYDIIARVEMARALQQNRDPHGVSALSHKVWDPYHIKTNTSE